MQILDGHNDSVHHVRVTEDGCAFLGSDGPGHIDLGRAAAGGFAGGFFAMFVAGPRREGEPRTVQTPEGQTVRYADEIDQGYALRGTMAMASRLFALEAASGGRFRIVRDVAAIRSALDEGAMAAILHSEGAEFVDRDLNSLHAFHDSGLGSLGLVWSRPNMFASGVPFAFQHSPDTGPGLTEDGKRLVRGCNELRVVIDLSHLNEAGFWDVAATSDAPLVASHSNAHAICPCTRNLTDRQLDAVRDSGGIVGVNFSVSFLRPDGGRGDDMPLTVMADHFDYLVGRMGIDHVGFGSDFDGCTVSRELGDVAGLPRLVDELRARGYDGEALEKLGTGNWLRVLEQTWGS